MDIANWISMHQYINVSICTDQWNVCVQLFMIIIWQNTWYQYGNIFDSHLRKLSLFIGIDHTKRALSSRIVITLAWYINTPILCIVPSVMCNHMNEWMHTHIIVLTDTNRQTDIYYLKNYVVSSIKVVNCTKLYPYKEFILYKYMVVKGMVISK